ncbi:glycosyltransferase family 2 protein [Cycloclasticus pugetii]|uniref:Glycosyltransferase n=1 Tax=Cycloclasticus pugetii TaxID=34068 RepID=A0AB33YYG7_9GAMM|nr:glycosyltransferase [Cycloclasticus pugetii]EPD12210.1 glycosyltransferase [Cycloclasticus pugetii]
MNIIDIVIPVYNDDSLLAQTVNSLESQLLPTGWSFHVHVVDDGSEHEIFLKDMNISSDDITLHRHPVNKGRGAACNTGVCMGNGDLVYILDSDCVLQNNHVLLSHIEILSEANVSVSCGNIYVDSVSFWGKYQNEVALRREELFKCGDLAAFTTANCMMTRKCFIEVGGFDEEFTQYGFEDRDLLLRLISKQFEIRYCKHCSVEHKCDLTLNSVVAKLYKGGMYSSALFIKKHPLAYEKMHFVKADVRYSKGGLQVLVLLTKRIVWPVVKMFDWILVKGILPYWFAKNVVKYISGLVYLHGTSEAEVSSYIE